MARPEYWRLMRLQREGTPFKWTCTVCQLPPEPVNHQQGMAMQADRDERAEVSLLFVFKNTKATVSSPTCINTEYVIN